MFAEFRLRLMRKTCDSTAAVGTLVSDDGLGKADLSRLRHFLNGRRPGRLDQDDLSFGASGRSDSKWKRWRKR